MLKGKLDHLTIQSTYMLNNNKDPHHSTNKADLQSQTNLQCCVIMNSVLLTLLSQVFECHTSCYATSSSSSSSSSACFSFNLMPVPPGPPPCLLCDDKCGRSKGKWKPRSSYCSHLMWVVFVLIGLYFMALHHLLKLCFSVFGQCLLIIWISIEFVGL